MPQEPTKIGRVRNSFYPFSVRKRVVELYESGLGSKKISRETGIDSSLVRRWLRRYREHGQQSLQPYYRNSRAKSIPLLHRERNEYQFKVAYAAYTGSLESVMSLTRRYKLDYHAFKYHVERYHPELVARRAMLKESII